MWKNRSVSYRLYCRLIYIYCRFAKMQKKKTDRFHTLLLFSAFNHLRKQHKNTLQKRGLVSEQFRESQIYLQTAYFHLPN